MPSSFRILPFLVGLLPLGCDTADDPDVARMIELCDAAEDCDAVVEAYLEDSAAPPPATADDFAVRRCTHGCGGGCPTPVTDLTATSAQTADGNDDEPSDVLTADRRVVDPPMPGYPTLVSR